MDICFIIRTIHPRMNGSQSTPLHPNPSKEHPMKKSLLSLRNLNKINKLYRHGFVRCDISRLMGIDVVFIPSCPKGINVPNLTAKHKSNRKPRIPINPTELNAMITMRNRGDTLQSIATAINRSTFAVYHHTRHIVNSRRWNREDIINRKTGEIIAA